ncbi:MAG: hypothetical protein AAGD01_20360 [Acidobacteriota bacterium]
MAAPSPALAQAPEDDPWVRVDTPHFTLFCQVQEEIELERALVLAEDLEALHAVLQGFMGDLAVRSTGPTLIYVYRDSESFQPVQRQVKRDSTGIVGFFLSAGHAQYVAVDGDSRRDVRRVIYHEYIHHFVKHHLPGMPLWFNEGLAEYYSTFRLVRGEEGGAVAQLGTPPTSLRRWLERSSLEPLAEILAANRGSHYYSDSDHRGAFYSQSWLLVHYLLNGAQVSPEALGRRSGDGDRGQQLVDYLARVADGEDASAAFEKAFRGVTYRMLERELEAYLLLPALPLLEVEVRAAPVADLDSAVSLSAARIRARLGDLWTRLPGAGSRETARRLLQEGYELNSEDPLVHRGLGYLELRAGNYLDALRWLQASVARESRDGETYELLGEAHLARALEARRALHPGAAENEKAVVERSVEKALSSFQQSAQLAPQVFGPWFGQGRSALVSYQRPSPGVFQALRRARTLKPESLNVLSLEAQLLARDGRPQAALQLVRRVAARRPQLAESMAGRLEQEMELQLRELLAAGELRGAVETLAAWAAGWEVAEDWEQAQRLRDEVRRLENHLQLRQALSWIEEGRRDEAEAELRELSWNAEEATLRQEAERILESLRTRP